MIHHHPGDDFLLRLAAGRMRGGEAVAVAVHLEACMHCRSRLHALQAAGGALLAELEPQLLQPDALARTLARIDAPQPPARPRVRAQPRIALPGGRPWPAALAGCDFSPWHWMGPGMSFARVGVPSDPRASVYLLRIAPGRSLASHSHSGLELTQVLCGSFDDGRSVFAAGDFDATDAAVHHQPVVAPGDVCVCLAYVEGRLAFDGRIAGAIGRWIGM